MRLIRTVLACTSTMVLLAAPSLASPRAGVDGATLAVEPVKTGLGNPAAFTFGPNDRIWFATRKTGRIRVLDPATGRTTLFTDVDEVDGEGERGALGLALHPAYPERPFVYLYVTRAEDGDVENQLLRFRSDGGKAVAERELFSWTSSSAKFHNGGRILFGPDGKLWIVTGDNGDPSNSQELDDLRGKVLRIGPAGAIPPSNPFGTRVYAFGIRNSFGMAFDPQTGRLWETENGPTCNDEINLIEAGGNFAWGPSQSCPADPAEAVPADTNQDGPEPRLLGATTIADTIGITGAAFCDGCGLGGDLEGDLIFGDVFGELWALDLDATRLVPEGPPVHLLSAPSSVFSVEAAADGTIHLSGPEGIYRLTAA